MRCALVTLLLCSWTPGAGLGARGEGSLLPVSEMVPKQRGRRGLGVNT